MALRIKVTSRSAGAIRHTGMAVRSVSPDVIARALEADAVASSGDVDGSPISLHALRRELETRVRSTGGRPALAGATKIQKIPLKPEDWSRLEELAARLSQEGVSATAGQVASVMVHQQLELTTMRRRRTTAAARAGGRRPATRP